MGEEARGQGRPYWCRCSRLLQVEASACGPSSPTAPRGKDRSTLGILARERATALLLTRFVSAATETSCGSATTGWTSLVALLSTALWAFTCRSRPTRGRSLAWVCSRRSRSRWGSSRRNCSSARARLGWTYARGARHLDVVLQLGPTLLGQVDLGSLHRSLGGLTWGAAVSSGWEELTLDLRMSQIGQDSAEGPVTDLRAEVWPTRWPARKTNQDDARSRRATFRWAEIAAIFALFCAPT